jgi:hypothetical protein
VVQKFNLGPELVTLTGKFESKLKSLVSKFDDLKSEMEKARATFKVKPPPDATPDELREYDATCKDMQQAIDFAIRRHAQTSGLFEEMSYSIKALRR